MKTIYVVNDHINIDDLAKSIKEGGIVRVDGEPHMDIKVIHIPDESDKPFDFIPWLCAAMVGILLVVLWIKFSC